MKCLKAVVVFCLISNLALAASPYKKSLKKWSEKGSDYSFNDFEAHLLWTVTYESLEFRTARVEEQVRLYKLSEDEKKKLLQKEKQEAALYDDFFASIYSGSGANRHLGKDSSLWRFLLKTSDSRQTDKATLEKIKVNDLDRHFYPYIDQWSLAYRIRFPKFLSEKEKQFSLEMVGVPASDQLTWEIKK